jgi:hypothetical protein
MILRFVERALVIIAVIFLIEVSSFTISFLRDIYVGESYAGAIEKRKAEFSSVSSLIPYGDYEPVGGRWSAVGTQFGDNLYFSQFGFPPNAVSVNVNPAAKEGSVSRILLLGGSSALGFGVKNPEETLSAKIEGHIRRADGWKKSEVLNFGQIGGHSGDTIRKLTSYLLYFQPDVLVWYTGYNDAVLSNEHRYLNWGWGSEEVLLDLYSEVAVGGLRFGLMPFTSALVNRVFFKAPVRKGIKDIRLQMDASSPIPKLASVANGSISSFQTNLRVFSAICKEFNLGCVVALQPASIWPSGNGLTVDNHNRDAILNWYPEYKLAVRHLAEKHSSNPYFGVLDLTSSFNNVDHSLVFLNDGFHLTPYGNDIIGKVLADAITKQSFPGKQKSK